ncbi:flagellar motor protein MotS [Bacillus sp. FJAT-52991]|uniref:Flagellar motor protein MotS n=1 Tax=Bacillus kandeliae TaxID=3129297 RepID=A0ABZ2N3Z0_9BACI
MMIKRRPPKQPKGSPKWMVTFADLVTLVLVFFILLFSMSQIDIVKFKAMAQSFKQQAMFDNQSSIVPGEYPSEEMKKEQAQKEEDSLSKLAKEVQQYLKEHGLEDVATATRTERGVVLVLQEKILFETADAVVVEEAYPFLNEIGKMLETKPNIIKVEGHTDNRPIQNTYYPSNWELSSARASSVIRFLSDNHDIDPKQFIAVGYGDTRPLVPNTSAENMQKNRRVEIIITDPKYTESE